MIYTILGYVGSSRTEHRDAGSVKEQGLELVGIGPNRQAD